MERCCMNTDEINMIEELEKDFIRDLAEFFKVFGDVTRIRILQILLSGERNVSELADSLSMTQSAISHQLRVLRQNDLVKYRKDGKTVFYSLDDDHIRTVLEQGMVHIRHKRGYVE
ncbi:ArsR/SmtB family transcription factor [Anaerotignum sp. MB30-C6]|uniref:ArsR/SmtB family transcription factor n=1 Tax=Anaerotignum sp. MB30-C6 TaxID=3070814 RepID=UPI0027DCADE0|nr:metalloregulator ArsR/SmtB family transcription factor [Anaerotignum sp. MB30-C6]WMI81487.1 metalloregulator ArsR/SmtB family transcription factor [Anaerotignum sp. MB30-C6]